MNYKKKYVNSLNNFKKRKEYVLYIWANNLKRKTAPSGFEITFTKLDPNLFTIFITSNLQGRSLLRVDKSS